MNAPERQVLVPFELDPRAPDASCVMHELHGLTMGTTWAVKCAAPAATHVRELRDRVESTLDRVVSQMSTWEADSDLSRYNRSRPGSWSTLPEECFLVLRHALAVAEASDGAYDPTAGPLVNAWGFGPEGGPGARPAATALESARRRVGWQRVELEPVTRRVYQPSGIHLDLSAIAKGYGVDAVVASLQQAGVAHALVEVGGELRGLGMKAGGQPWWIQLENPPACDGGLAALPQTVIALHGVSVATSGDYRRFYFASGACSSARYSHTIDPRSGEPIRHGLAAVTVVHPDCWAADAISTALNVLGADRGLHFAVEHGIAARFVQRVGDGYVERLSPALEALSL